MLTNLGYTLKKLAPLENLIENLSYYIEMALNETPSKPADNLTIDEVLQFVFIQLNGQNNVKVFIFN